MAKSSHQKLGKVKKLSSKKLLLRRLFDEVAGLKRLAKDLARRVEALEKLQREDAQSDGATADTIASLRQDIAKLQLATDNRLGPRLGHVTPAAQPHLISVSRPATEIPGGTPPATPGGPTIG